MRGRVYSPLRRRIDNVALRWHARLDSPFADRSLPWLLAGGVFLALAALALARVRSLEPSESLARYSQAVWQLHGDQPDRLSLVPAGVASPQPLSHLDGSLLLYPLGWLLGFLPVRASLVTLQSAALALTVLPLWRLARGVANLRVGATTALVVAFALFPSVHVMNVDGFDPLVLAVPVLMSLIHRALSGQILRLGATALLALACSMQLSLVLVGFGIALALTVRRRAGIGLAALGAVATLGSQTVSWLGAGDQAFVDASSFPAGTNSAVEILARLVVHPLASLEHLTERRVLVVLAALLVPVALLPLMSLRHLLPVLPLQLAYLLGDGTPAVMVGPLAAACTPFVFSAATFALARLGRPGSDRVHVPPRLSGVLVAVAALYFVLDAPPSPYNQPWGWGGKDNLDLVRDRWVAAALEQDDDVMVAATADMSPLLAARRPVCALPLERFACPRPPELFLIDRELDWTTPLLDGLELVETDGDGRFVLLRRRP